MTVFRLTLLLASLGLAGCRCGDARLKQVPPEPEQVVPFHADTVLPPATLACRSGSVRGKVCAPDKHTWVGGAVVSVAGTDCSGEPFTLSTSTTADGAFDLTEIPVGAWTAHATLGAFSQDYPVTITSDGTTAIPEDQLCVAQKQTKIAVVTGAGDQIEQLLLGLNLQFDSYAGDATNWPTSAGPFLSDVNRLKAYDLVFIDCAAGKSSGTVIDLGTRAAPIAAALKAYVTQGGSLYASDWAMLFPALAFPGKMNFKLNGGTVASPLDAKHLMGYAPQSVTASLTSPALATFVGKPSIQIAFPHQAGVNSTHWALFTSQDSSADVLIRAPAVTACSTTDTSCSTGGAQLSQVPLAVHFKVGPAGSRGGNVVFTSFHNIAQPTEDVSLVLKYIVLHL